MSKLNSDLSDNTIHGSIPYQIGYLFQLITLTLGQNLLTGKIPPSLGRLSSLQALSLRQNLLTGEIPPSFGRLSSLQVLSLRSNQLSGEIPRELGDLSQLRSLPENGLSGTLPPELGKLSNLQELWLTSNNLRGDLPKDYENLKNLTTFEISGNNLSGPIPRFIAKWVNLYSLFVTDLQTKGLSFPESANLSSILSLTLRNCSITGSIPPYIANWNQLRFLDLSFNNLTGGIPSTFKNLFLYQMYLTRNMLNGTLPDWIYRNVWELKSKIRGKFMDLAYNQFRFPEPETHKNLPHNNSRINLTFPEEIVRKYCPDGQKKSQYNSTSNFYVNKPANNWAYSCNGHFYGDSMADSSKFVQKVTCGAAVTGASLYDEARLCPNSLKYYGFCLRNGNYNISLYFSEIVFTNNDDYSSSAKRVFDIYIQRELRLKDFNIKEMARHSNNVTIQSFEASVREHLLEIELFWAGKGSLYAPPSFHGPLTSAISVTPTTVQNFEVNRPGRLSKIGIVAIVLGAVLALILFLALMSRLGWIGDRELRDANSSTRLDWPTRVRICHGIVKGLKYLHEDNPSRKIVHRNIKPSNILLDGNLNAKVSDLGLAKLYDEENPYKFIQEKGTVVYMAPEYAMRKAITEKAIVLHSKGRLSELVDKQMPNEHVVMKQAKIILELAMRCVDQSPTLRPTMSEVLSELERISN
ncbi:putative LRR receptor-like serine/threonine-protein kinase [Citrus sinensis]|uniref:LRR receptor-like serine/threonine-protein kinase n=1 Tax=Citrus sinensis TaxID=2711 RepID=A0ACB8IPK4_CITSI|nr:putative LRR receptor-like serine/threonine-protein kinase [Citrus sinensis]